MDKLNEWVVLVVDDSLVFRSILDVYLRDMVGTLLGAEDGVYSPLNLTLRFPGNLFRLGGRIGRRSI